jgi:peptidoglycan/xylan/chitin deacetylase (PgdA/CDA1 family)
MPIATLSALSPKHLGRRVLTSGGIYPLVRRRALRGDPVTVLMYHTLGGDDEDFDAWTVVRQSDFRAQMRWLQRHYDIVSLDEAWEHACGHGAAERPKAVITFDDGHSGLHRYLLPLLDELRLPVTLYVATGHIVTGRPYWFDRIMNALQVRHRILLDLSRFGLPVFGVEPGVGEGRWQTLGPVLEALKTLDPAVREAAVDAAEEQLRPARRDDFDALAPLSLAQLQEIARCPWVTIGAHTECHSLLDQLSPDAAQASMELSARRLRDWTGAKVRHFAYPNGNHNAELMARARDAGFDTALTTRKGLWRRGDSAFSVARVPVGRYDDLARFKLNLLANAWRH